MTEQRPSNSLVPDQERDAFEAWALDKFSLHRNPRDPSRYLMETAAVSWKAWRARADLAIRESATLAGQARYLLKDQAAKADEIERLSATIEPLSGDALLKKLEGQCQAVWRTSFTIVCTLPKGHDGDHRADCGYTFNGEVDVRASQPPPAVRKCHHAFDVLVITTAYESGFGHGQQLDELPNPYAEGSPEHHAYSIGYDEGEQRRRMNGSSGYCNQGTHGACTNKECMCKCHSPTKEPTRGSFLHETKTPADTSEGLVSPPPGMFPDETGESQ